MKKTDKTSPHPAPVADIVNALLQDARKGRVDGPSSMLHGARAQLSSTVNQAGVLLAKLDRAAPPAPTPTLLQNLLGLSTVKASAKKRSWFFASRNAADGLSSKRIEQLLKDVQKGSERVSFGVTPGKESGEDVHCELPEGASDPVCEPRRS